MDIDDALKDRTAVRTALTRLGDAIVTGHTGTNVMNLRVLLVRKPRQPGRPHLAVRAETLVETARTPLRS